jgi:Lon protease-like protein
MSDDLSPLANYSGTVRLFPLPNLVLFPHVMQPLHIFEPRYRQMTADALADDRLIALVLLRPGWEAHYEGRPAIHPVGCIGRIVAEQRLEDGRFNILLRGLCRVQVRQELETASLYRVARADLLAEGTGPEGDAARKLRRRMTRTVPKWFPAQAAVLEQFRKLLRSELPLGALCDIITFALPLDVAVKQELLEELDAGRRIKQLLTYLEAHAPAGADKPGAKPTERKFPPEFSAN